MRKVLIQALAACCLMTAAARASTNVFDFNSDPSGILNVFRSGDNETATALAGVWFPTNGSTLEAVADQSTNGYFAITQVGGGHRAVIVFDDFDAGLVVAAFKFQADVRIGAGTDDPADGFSLNYARANDPVIINNDGSGFAASPGGEGNLPEEGTQTGLSICFDAWDSGSGDVIGLTIRVDNVIRTNFALPTKNGLCADATSMQTGPNGSGVGALCWQPLYAELTADGKLNVSYKGVAFLTNYPVNFAAGPGRLIFGGRVGGSNQHQHVDNIRLVTIASASPVVGPSVANANGFRFSIADSGSATPDTNTITVTLDGVPVIPNSITQSGNVGGGDGSTLVSYQNAGLLLASGSTHTNVIRFTGTTFSGTVEVTNVFTVPAYTLLTSAHKAPGAVNTGLSGFAGRVHQLPVGRYPSATSVTGIERQLADGFIDPNTGQPYVSTTVGGISTFTDDDAINWGQDVPIDTVPGFSDVGNFQSDSAAPADWPDEPIPGVDANQNNNTDNVAAEVLAILNLPVGAYQLGVQHDDAFALTAGAEPRDVFGATLLSTDGGATDTLGINVVVTNAGNYPVRLVWGEAGGGAQLEFYLVDFNTGQKILVNNRTNPVQITAYRDLTALTQPYVRWTYPAAGETGINPDATIIVKLEDGSAATINDGAIQILLNGASLTVGIANSGTTTTASANHSTLASNSLNTVTLVYSTSAGGPFTNSWTFTAAAYAPLPTNLRTPLGSADAGQPGFNGRVWQVGVGQFANFQNDNDVTDVALLGVWGTNQATVDAFTIPDVINIGVASEGSFANPTGSMPGLPGFGASTDNVAYEFLTFLEFPTPGFYSMGVQSDDGFRLTLGDTAGPSVPSVVVTAPAGIARRLGALQTFQPRNGFGGPIPAAGISNQVVIASPIVVDGPLNNAAALAGRIAYVERGVVGFAVKAKAVQDAGAVAMILGNATVATGLPQIMGGADASVTIPCFMISQQDGALIAANATTSGNSPVFMHIAAGDQRLVLGQFSGGRGAGTPTTFGMYVPEAGVYPFRLCFENAGGGNSVEWWSETATGARILINDSNVAGAIKAYRARTVTGGVPQFTDIGTSAGGVRFSWTGVGEIQQSPTLNGPWTTAANQNNPQTNSPSGATQLLYRVRQY